MTETGIWRRLSNEACGRSILEVNSGQFWSILRSISEKRVLNSVKQVLKSVKRVLNSVKPVIFSVKLSQTAV